MNALRTDAFEKKHNTVKLNLPKLIHCRANCQGQGPRGFRACLMTQNGAVVSSNSYHLPFTEAVTKTQCGKWILWDLQGVTGRVLRAYTVPGAALTPHRGSSLDPSIAPGAGALISHWPMGSLKHKEVKSLVPGPTTSKWWLWSSGSLVQGAVLKSSQVELCLRCYLYEEF